MLDTRFPRPPGDAGNPVSWPVPVIRRVVPRAWPDSVVTAAHALRASALPGLFIEAARALEREGARSISTSCGFLVLLQRELQQAVQVPVVTSSLLLLPGLLREEPEVGVLTIDASSLGAEHLACAGVPGDRLGDVKVQGVDRRGEFARRILGNEPAMDPGRARWDVVDAALRLQAECPGVRTLVLECTNMPPHAEAIRRATGWRVLSLVDAWASRVAGA